MNWLLLIDLWEDWWDGSNPPIHWNPTAQRFEFLVTPPPGQTQQIGLWMPNPHDEDGVIDFEYQIDHYTPMGGYVAPRINIVENSSNVISSTEISNGATGRITVNAKAGNTYAILLSYFEGDYYAGYFYGFEGIITPYQEVVPPTRVLPWWLCVRPAPPEPCPVRINPAEEFVPFEDYDVDFKFPLASSRKPMKIKRPTDCIVCAPTLIDEVPPDPDPDPEPEPECAAIVVTPYFPTQLSSFSGSWDNTPDWFSYGNTHSFLVRFPSTNDDTIYLFQWNGSAYDAIDWNNHDDAQIPFDNYEEAIQGEWAEAEDAGLEDHTWSCVMVSTYTPA